MSSDEVLRLKNDNMASIQYLFKRASHAVGARSPVEMSDPAAVSRLLGELFANMQEEENKWLQEVRGCKGWVCDLPEKLGGGTISYTAVNPSCSRMQVQGNKKWNTTNAVEIKTDIDDDREQLDKAMLRFAQEGLLLELSGQEQLDTLPAGATRITMMRDSKDQMRVFQVKDAHESRRNLQRILALIQQVNMKQNAGEEKLAAAVVAN